MGEKLVKVINDGLVGFVMVLKLLLFAGDIGFFLNGFTHDFKFVVDALKGKLFAVP